MVLLRRLLPLACGLLLGARGQQMPQCRKSPELHAVRSKDEGEKALEVVAFGGKGFGWKLDSWYDTWTEEDDLSKEVQFFSDTWTFSPISKEWARVQFDEGSKGPVSRWKPSSTTFDGDARMAIFGGCHGTDVKGVLNDLWVLDLLSPERGTWTQVATKNPPRQRRGHIAVANKTHFIVAGGKGWTEEYGTEVLTDLWILPLPALRPCGGGLPKNLDGVLQRKKLPSWIAGQPFPAHPRWGATGELLDMPGGKQVIALFGGRNKNKGAKLHSTEDGAYTYFNDLWFYHFDQDSWELAETKGELPGVRDHHGAASFGTELFVFGGRTSEQRKKSATLNDLWSYSTLSSRWTLHKAGETAPDPRFMPGVTLLPDPKRDQLSVVIFAGETFPGSTKRSSRNDLWAYDIDLKSGKGAWREVAADDCSAKATATRKVLESEDSSEDKPERLSAALGLRARAPRPEGRREEEAPTEELAGAARWPAPALLVASAAALLGLVAASLAAPRRSAASQPLLAADAGEQ